MSKTRKIDTSETQRGIRPFMDAFFRRESRRKYNKRVKLETKHKVITLLKKKLNSGRMMRNGAPSETRYITVYTIMDIIDLLEDKKL